jgi:integrase
MSENTIRTRTVQWNHYFDFCRVLNEKPLPASMDLVTMYLAFMAERFTYTSVINYLSALWVLHKTYGFPHLDPSDFRIKTTLGGIKRALGDAKVQAPPLTPQQLSLIYAALDLSSTEDLCFWTALLLGFRALLRKSNLFEPGLALTVKDVFRYKWGTHLVISRSKTIQYRQRIHNVFMANMATTKFCVSHYINMLMALVVYQSPNSHLLSYSVGGKSKHATYRWFSAKLKKLCIKLNLPALTSHSMRRGGASALAEAGISLQDLQELGDWRSMQVLEYLERSTSSRVALDVTMSRKLFGAFM